ncbi:pyridoxal phosphate-dependent decarboxylase family protein [Leptolyngbya sp. NIES-2104]|uniref:pyridoxal phosphate-dependent decarboxylase family protein n=1 Tax=Leptolyngbya sp. NIES-2104 TaxID=1552121 RepID=UPI0006EC7A12|nr:aspartate aminotransferase family protein [Leptolyngbya sp. NIES-2104]GAP99525.1 siderophore biosynthesis L-2,4-diaminobutyrate decarboxylase [Leptolyngbya sp. NIES-2104]
MSEPHELLSKVLERVNRYLVENSDSNTRVVQCHPPEALKAKIDLSIPEQGVTVDRFLALIETYLTYSVRTGHKQFFNQLFAGFNLPGLIGELLISLTNTSIATYEIAPIATLIEQELIHTLNSLIGFTQGEGTFVTGGSNANLVAMMCARNKMLPEAKHQGIQSNPLTVFVSDQAHYSFLKAANVLGIGLNRVIKVETDDQGRIIPQALENAIAKSYASGEIPFFVAATAGTTVLGAFDPLIEMAQIAQKYNLWFHIDGAWGGAAILSDRVRHLLSGSELADSFTWDAHKLMGVPFVCSALLLRQPGMLTQTVSNADTDYLFHDHADAAYDLGIMSLQCGRKADALKLWLAWQYYGKRGYEQRINHLLEMTRYATKKVDECLELELVAPVQFLNVCFRYVSTDAPDLDQFNLELRDRLVKSGKSLVNYALINGKIALRLILANPEIAPTDLDQFFENILEVGREPKSFT